MSITRRDTLALVGGLAAAGTATAQTPTPATPQTGGTLIMLVHPEPTSLGLHFSAGGQTTQVVTKVVEGLLDYDMAMNPIPSLAVSWEVAPDFLTYTFRLRPNVTWHDGQPFTSADVQHSFMEILPASHPRHPSNFGAVTAVETPDPLTAIFRLSAPSPVFMKVLGAEEAPILPRHLYEGTNIRQNPANNAPIGTGPFIFREWVRGRTITLERNPRYWGEGLPRLERMIMRFGADAGTRAAVIERGEVQVAVPGAVATVDLRRLAALPALTVETLGTAPYAPMMFLELNLRRPPFNDLRVRRAIAHAIDRRFILENVWFGFGKVATGPIASSFTNYYEPNVRSYDFNLDTARRLLDEAGLRPGPDGVRLRITHDVSPAGEDWRRMGEYIRQALGRVGIQVTLRQEDGPSFLRRVYTDNDFEMTSNSFISLSDPTSGVQRVYWSKNIRRGVAFSNASGYSDPEGDAMWEEAAREPREARRTELFKALQRRIVDDVPVLWIMEMVYPTILNRRARDVMASPFGVRHHMGRAWVAPG